MIHAVVGKMQCLGLDLTAGPDQSAVALHRAKKANLDQNQFDRQYF